MSEIEIPINKLVSSQTGISKIQTKNGSMHDGIVVEFGFETIGMLPRSHHPGHADHPFLICMSRDDAESLANALLGRVKEILPLNE